MRVSTYARKRGIVCARERVLWACVQVPLCVCVCVCGCVVVCCIYCNTEVQMEVHYVMRVSCRNNRKGVEFLLLLFSRFFPKPPSELLDCSTNRS